MIARFILLLGLPLLLSGCQLGAVLNTLNENRVCLLDNADFSQLQQVETLYLHQPDQRQSLLKQAQLDKDLPLQAVLMSQPQAGSEQLQQALKLYQRLVLYPNPNCPGDTYLSLRQGFAQDLLALRREQVSLRQQNQEMQAKINALTEIENELTRERETTP